MNRLLSLLLSVFGRDLTLDRLQAIFARLAEQFLPDIAHAAECRTQLLTWLRTGTLDDVIKRDPKSVIVCVGYVVLGLLAGQHEHDDSPDADPVIIVGAQDTAECLELCQLLGIPQVAGATVDDASAIPPALWVLLAEALVQIIKKALDQWLD